MRRGIPAIAYGRRPRADYFDSTSLIDTLFSRNENAWFLSGYAARPAGFVRLRFPDGAPVFHATTTRLDNGASLYPLARVMRHECRVFVQQRSGIVTCTTRSRGHRGAELSLGIQGLSDAT